MDRKYRVADGGNGFESLAHDAPGPHRDEFAVHWLQHRQALFQRCLRLMSGRRDDAEEAFGRASLLAFQKYPTHRAGIRDVRSWLLGLLRNVCMDFFRERARERRHTALDLTTEAMLDLDQPNPEMRLQAHELAMVVRASVARLPWRLRLPVQLHLSSSLCDREIADALDITEASVRKRLQVARALLRPLLRAYLDCKALPPPPDAPAIDAPVPLRWALRMISIELEGGAFVSAPVLLPCPVPRTGPRGLAALERYLRSHPTGWRKRFELALVLVADSRPGEAIEHLTAVVERRPQTMEAWLTLVRVLRACGREAEARQEAGRAAQALRPTGGRREWLHGATAGRRGVAALEAAACLRPRDAGPRLSLAELHIRRGRPGRALAAIEAALEVGGDQPATLALAFDPLCAASRQATAVHRLERALMLDPHDAGTLVRVVMLRARRRFEPEGNAALRRRLEELTSPEACEALSLHDALGGRGELARRRVLDLCRAQPMHSGAWLAAGRIGLATAAFEAAAVSLRQAVRLAPQVRAAHIELCHALCRTGNVGEALRVAHAALERFPDDWWVVSGVAAAVADSGAPLWPFVAAAQALLVREASLAASWFCLGRLLAAQRDVAAAIEALLEGWKRLPPEDGFLDSAPAALRLADLYAIRQDLEAARTWYRTAATHAKKLGAFDVAQADACAHRARAGLATLQVATEGTAHAHSKNAVP